MKRVIKLVGGIIILLYISVAIILTISLLCYNEYEVTVFGDKTIITIVDDEISNEFRKGDLVILSKSKESELKVGEYVFFYNTYSNENEISYAKISKKNESNNGVDYIIEDGYYLSYDNIIGISKKGIVFHKIGYIVNFLESRIGFLFCIIMPILLLFIYEIYAIILEIKGIKD